MAQPRGGMRHDPTWDTDLPQRIEEAEEDTENQPGTLGDVPLEPFHLKEERKRGYFDEDGGYVQQKRGKASEKKVGKKRKDEEEEEEEEDEWTKTVPIDDRYEQQEEIGDDEEEEEIEELDTIQPMQLKAKMVKYMMDGESVTKAIQRWGKQRKQTKSIEAKQGIEFLTEMASQLMEVGDYDIYSKTKNVLEQESGKFRQPKEVEDNATFEEDMFS